MKPQTFQCSECGSTKADVEKYAWTNMINYQAYHKVTCADCKHSLYFLASKYKKIFGSN